MKEMKFPESLTNNDNDSEFNDPGSELRFVWDRDAKVYVKKLVHRAVSFAGGQKFSAPLHKETCNCGTVPYVNGPKNGCPGPKPEPPPLPIEFQASTGSPCPSCREPRIEPMIAGKFRCDFCGAVYDAEGNTTRGSRRR